MNTAYCWIVRSRSELKPEIVFKVQKMAQYASFCLTVGPFKGEVPVFLPDYGTLGLGLVLRLSSTVAHPSNSWASC